MFNTPNSGAKLLGFTAQFYHLPLYELGTVLDMGLQVQDGAITTSLVGPEQGKVLQKVHDCSLHCAWCSYHQGNGSLAPEVPSQPLDTLTRDDLDTGSQWAYNLPHLLPNPNQFLIFLSFTEASGLWPGAHMDVHYFLPQRMSASGVSGPSPGSEPLW